MPASIPYRFFVIVISSKIGRCADSEQYQDHCLPRLPRGGGSRGSLA
jgi:hypothetical protein